MCVISSTGPVHHHNDSERHGKLRGNRESSEELEKNSKKKMDRTECEKRSTHPKKSKHTTVQRTVESNKRHGKKNHKSDIDELPNGIFPIENLEKETFGSNPFRSNRPSESTVSQPSDKNDSTLKVEVPCPTSSRSGTDGKTLKRKHDTNNDNESDDVERDKKRRIISESDAESGIKTHFTFVITIQFFIFVFITQVKKMMLQIWKI